MAWSYKKRVTNVGGYGCGSQSYAYVILRDDTEVAVTGFGHIAENIVDCMNKGEKNA